MTKQEIREYLEELGEFYPGIIIVYKTNQWWSQLFVEVKDRYVAGEKVKYIASRFRSKVIEADTVTTKDLDKVFKSHKRSARGKADDYDAIKSWTNENIKFPYSNMFIYPRNIVFTMLPSDAVDNFSSFHATLSYSFNSKEKKVIINNTGATKHLYIGDFFMDWQKMAFKKEEVELKLEEHEN